MFVGLFGSLWLEGRGGNVMVVGEGCRRMVDVLGVLDFGGRDCDDALGQYGVLDYGGVLDHDRDVSSGDDDAALLYHRVDGNANLYRAIRSSHGLDLRCLSRRSVRWREGVC